MAKAKKLPSGSWRCQAYSHSIPVFDKSGNPVIDEKTGKQKIRRIYESFTAESRKEAELLAAQFQVEKSQHPTKKQQETANMTLTEAIDAYITSREVLDRSPTTIQEYRCTQKYGFQDIMGMKLSELDETILQEAINVEARRAPSSRSKSKTISAKRLRNEWGLIASVLKKYRKDLIISVELPAATERVPELLSAETVLQTVKGTDIELAVLLAAWLSFSMSEVRGLTKSKSISGDHIRIAEVVVTVNKKDIRKKIGKNKYRNRTHRIPPYIKKLIDQVDGDVLVPMSAATLHHRWDRLLDENNLQHMTFHDLRHLNASVMALLRIPDKYAQERGGWKSDKVMKKVYTQTFPEERERIDNIIDGYFQELVEPEAQGFNQKKYQAWLILFDKTESEESKKEFLEFIQHEMQHKKNKA